MSRSLIIPNNPYAALSRTADAERDRTLPVPFSSRSSPDLNREARFSPRSTPRILAFHDILHENLSQMGINRDELACL